MTFYYLKSEIYYLIINDEKATIGTTLHPPTISSPIHKFQYIRQQGLF
jgi:hypothetical protein